MRNVHLASTAARRRQDSHVASCSPPDCTEQFITACAFHCSAVQCRDGADLPLSPCRAIQDRDKAVYEAEELKTLSREQQGRLLVAETTAEQESTLRQGRQLGWPGVGGVAAHAGSWTAGRRAYCWAGVRPQAKLAAWLAWRGRGERSCR